ncbi:uncharacterized protein [Primulina eburnea]|uniref:uncharacterized protein n=1 Tax=Primulina eburnea TaxID=1245227 RepID=UPI003C6CB110
MVSQTLIIEGLILRLFSMLRRRDVVQFAKNLCCAVVLLCSVLALVTCKRYPVTEASNQLDTETCGSYGANFDTSYSDVFGGHNSSEMVSSSTVQQRGLENICLPLNSFCFPSTLSGVLFDEIDSNLEVLDDSGDFSSGLKQVGSSISRSLDRSIFQLSDGRTILCSLQQEDGFERQTENSSCTRPSSDYKTLLSKSGKNVDTVKYDSLDDLSTPPVEINPSLLDWGRKNVYHPSLAFLTVKNIGDDRNLSIYHPYSSNLHFYPCNFSETLLAPGEVASICFIFLPTKLGLSSTQLVLQTSIGGFLVHAKGFAVESPYLIKPLIDLNVSSIGRWRKNLSLFNPFNETLYVEEINAWISVSSRNTSGSSKAVCRIHTVEDTSDYNILSAKDWLDVESGVVGSPHISMRPHMNWEIAPQKTEAVMELDFSQRFEGKVGGAFCLLLRSSTNRIDTLMIPLDVELSPHSAMDTGNVSVFIETLVPCSSNGSSTFALAVRNNHPYLLNAIKVSEAGDGTNTFEIKSVEGLLLFPRSTTQVAILNYTHLGTPRADLDCKLLVWINDSRISQIEIPCIDVINICSKDKELDYSVGYAQKINNIVYIKGRQTSYRSSIQAPSETKAMDSSEAEEFVLRNWKSQATSNFMSVLDDNELLFPMVHVGNYCSQWIAVKNPSQQPIAMQLILNSGEVIDKCRTSELLLLPSSSKTFLSDKLSSPIRYGFSLADNAITEALIHPHGSAFFGPILFQPSNRCEWRSSALVRNNLSGVEWISLQGFGGSLSMVLLEESEPVQGLEFKLKLPTKLNFSSFASTEKSSSCYQPLTKEVYAKNSGDLSMEVIRIDVSGSKCGLDGFRVRNCKGFSLQPGESMRLQLSYQTDFSSARIQRNLELVLATGILVIPMKASLPMYMMDFCKRSMFWILVKKAVVVVLVAATLSFLLVSLLPCFTAFFPDEIKNGKKSSSTMNLVERSFEKEEASTLESSGKSLDCNISGKGHDDPAAKCQMKNNTLLGAQPEFRLASGLSKSLCVVNSDAQDATDSRNLRVIIAKEKVRRRKKKKSSTIGLFELSSSQSGNSTPSSPLSPVSSIIPKRSCLVSPDGEQFVENRNPFAQTPDQKCDDEEISDTPSMVNLLEIEVSSKCGNKNPGCSPLERPSLTRNVASKAVLLPSATFPSAWRAAPTWACQSPYLASTSRIAPHARAPGSKLQNQKSGEREVKTLFKKEISVEEKAGLEEKFTYDIWGDHLFELPFTHSPNDSPGKCPRAIESDSESFFVRGPPTLFTNSLLNPVNSKMEGNELASYE